MACCKLFSNQYDFQSCLFCAFIFIGEKCFAERILVKSKDDLLNSNSFELNVEHLVLILIFILLR